MSRRKLRMILMIGPWGFHGFPIDVYFTDRREDLASYARAEGQALCFVLEDTDLSCRFAEALKRGIFLEDARRGEWRLTFRYFDEAEPGARFKESMRQLEALDKGLDEALESGDLQVIQRGRITEIKQREMTDEDWEVVRQRIAEHPTLREFVDAMYSPKETEEEG